MRPSIPLRSLLLLLPIALVTLPVVRADDPDARKQIPDRAWLSALKWRSIGPANMSGRVTAIAVYERDPSIYYVATASGGLLKTTNAGVTFVHQFDREQTVSIGDVAVAQSNPNIVWVGTGEANPRNSVSYGDGVYKSVDGGKTWKNMGLKRSFQIGKILIHPTNPDIVYVGALGRLYGPNRQRGLFKTTDGGKTWKHILFIDENTGVIDMRMHPRNPDILLVATYERRRDGFDTNDPAVKWGKGSGLYKTTDGGKTFRKITKGIPDCRLGRIGLDWYRKNPKVVYMVLETELIGKAPKGVKVGNGYMGITGTDEKGGGAKLLRVLDDGPADKAGLQAGDIVVQFGKQPIKKYEDLIKGIREHNAGDKVKVVYRRGDTKLSTTVVLGKRRGGPRKDRPFMTRLGGQVQNVQHKQGKEGWKYGGVYRSDDGGESWRRVNSLNPRPMYFSQIRVDPSDDRYVYVLGISLHRSKDGGRKFSNDGGRGCHPDHHALWINPNDGRHMILGNDGGFYITHDRMKNWDHINRFALGQFYHVTVGPRHRYFVYGGLQDNGTWGGPSFTLDPFGPVNSDWFRVGGGDGFRCQVDPQDPDLVYFESQNGNLRRRNFRTGEGAAIRPPNKKGVKYRWNWNTPFILSHHNGKIYYCAGNYVFKSLDRGDNLQIISPEITLTDRGSATALAESPLDPNVLYVGTDDGALWVTRDGGKNWKNITYQVGLPGPRWVASIECSRFKPGRVYAAFDAHRSDDDEPYVYVSEDYGESWRSIRSNLPWGSTRCLREDIKNPNLLYLGTEFGAWFSLDRGYTWHSLNTNLPTVAVHEIAIHPTAGEIVAATHGRSLWVLDVSALRQINIDEFAREPQLYKPMKAIRWVAAPSRGRTNQQFNGQNPDRGAAIWFSLPPQARKVSLTIHDATGKQIRALKVSAKPGLHRVVWDLRRMVVRTFRGRKRPVPVPVVAGTYRVVLRVDGSEWAEPLQVLNDPRLPADFEAAEDSDMDDEMDHEAGCDY